MNANIIKSLLTFLWITFQLVILLLLNFRKIFILCYRSVHLPVTCSGDQLLDIMDPELILAPEPIYVKVECLID